MSSQTPRFLFVDGDGQCRDDLSRLGASVGASVQCVGAVDEALALFGQNPFPVVVTELRLPGADGVSLIREMQRIHPETAFVVVTDHADMLEVLGDSTVDKGIISLVMKPFDCEQVVSSLERAWGTYLTRTGRGSASADPVSGPFLLVEDNPGDARLLSVMLSETSYRWNNVEKTDRLADAVDRLGSGTYEAILADLSLPDARGLDAVTRLVAAAPDTPLVVLSGMDDAAFSIQAVELGAQDFLSKDRLNARDLERSIRYATQRKRTERRLAYLARHDGLTGLVNREAFRERVDQTLLRSKRHERRFAVLYLDLDGFKEINDTFGHDAGDAVLTEVTRRIEGAIRGSDIAARLGGDEFGVLLEEVQTRHVAAIVVERILAAVRKPLELEEGEARVGGSIGVALFPEAGTDVDSLIRAADAAMYEAKRGQGNYRLVGGDVPGSDPPFGPPAASARRVPVHTGNIV